LSVWRLYIYMEHTPPVSAPRLTATPGGLLCGRIRAEFFGRMHHSIDRGA